MVVTIAVAGFPIAGWQGSAKPALAAVGTITSVAGNGTAGYGGDGGPATSAAINGPPSVAYDSVGNLYIGDYANNRVRRVNRAGVITTVAGNGTYGYSGDDGQATSAAFRNPGGIVIDSQGNLYISDVGNHRVRKVSADGVITTVACNGIAGFAGDGEQRRRRGSMGPSAWPSTDPGTCWSAITTTTGCARWRRTGLSQPSPAPALPAPAVTAGRPSPPS